MLNSNVSYEKSEQVQQANTFKHQSLTLHLLAYRQNSFKHSSHQTLVRLCERIDCCDRCIGRRNNSDQLVPHQRHFLDHEPIFFTPNMYCWSRKKPVTTPWMHLTVNGICTNSFSQRKWITEGCSLQNTFNGNIAISNVSQWRHSDVIKIKFLPYTQS